MNKKLLAVFVVGAVGAQTAQLNAVPGEGIPSWIFSTLWTKALSDEYVKLEPYQANGADVLVIDWSNKIGKWEKGEVSNLTEKIAVNDHLYINPDGTVSKKVNKAPEGQGPDIEWQLVDYGDDNADVSLKKEVDSYLSSSFEPTRVKDNKGTTYSICGTEGKGETFKIADPTDPEELAADICNEIIKKRVAKDPNDPVTWADKAAWNHATGNLDGLWKSRFKKMGSRGATLAALALGYSFGSAYNDEEDDDDENDDENEEE